MSNTKSLTECTGELGLDKKSLLAIYEECGAHMRFYAEARFKIMAVAVALVSALVTAQKIISPMGEGLNPVLGFIGLVSTMVLFSIEYRYTQAWLALYEWAERNVEDKLFGEGKGPLNSYKDLPKPWYILKSKDAPNILYCLLIIVCVADIGYYVYRLIAS